jgi:tRNA nucleotidyltransferase (CCA-adding enzyme)
MPERNLASTIEARMPEGAVRCLRALGEIADARGAVALVVGGVVRDLLLGVPNCDLDVVVSEPAPEFGAAAARALGGEVKAVTRFGTALLVLPGGIKVDLATARSEVYERPGALPTVASGTLADDLLRRDFTLNSLAVVINREGFGTLIDHFGGLQDLERGVLRVLTDRSFEDDPTRILRAVRLSARYGFRLDEHTEDILKRAVTEGCLSTVTGERILNEIVLILREPDPWPSVARLAGWGILAGIDPAWSGDAVEAVFQDVVRAIRPADGESTAPEAEPWIAFLLALLDPVPPDGRKRILDRLAAPRRARDAVRHAGELETLATGRLGEPGEIGRSEVRRLLARFAPEALVVAMAKRPASVVAGRILLFLTDLRHVRTELAGRDIAALGVPQGPVVGRILSALLDARLDGVVSSAADEEALARALARNLDTGNNVC